MPQFKKQKHSAKSGQKGSSKDSWKSKQVLDYYKFFTEVLQLQDQQHSFPERDSWIRTVLRNNPDSSNQPSNQEEENRLLLLIRYVWLDVIGWCPGTSIIDIPQCTEVLRLLDENARQFMSHGEVAQTLQNRSRQDGILRDEKLKKFPEITKLRLRDFDKNLPRSSNRHSHVLLQNDIVP